MDQARQLSEQGKSDQAIAQYEEIAQRNPARADPWSDIAKLRFDEHKYAQAIVASEEALNRDSNDFVAKSVRAVSGLRIGMQALADLKSDALLAGNARSDALGLAAVMRETLGEDILFPEGKKPPPRRPVRRPARPKPSTDTDTAAPAVQPAAPPSGGAVSREPDPFGNLLNKKP